jgi:hypothetical protein
MMARIMLNLLEVKTDVSEDSRSQQDVSRVELDTVWTSDLGYRRTIISIASNP